MVLNQTAGKKKLLVLTSTFPRWRNDNEPPFVYELCRRLKERYAIHVLAPHCRGALKTERLEGITVTRFQYFFTALQSLAYQGGILASLKEKKWRYLLVPFFIAAELFVLVRLLRRTRYDLIHAHWLLPQGLVAMLAAKLVKAPVPLLCTSHGGDLYGLQGRLFDSLKRAVFTQAAAITVVSQAMRTTAIQTGATPAKLHVIPMGVDLKKRFVPSGRKRSAGAVLFVGRLVPKKGSRYLIEALPLIREKCPEVALKIIGAGQEKDNLQKLAAGLGVSDRVRFLGALGQERLPEHYRKAAVVVFPSVVAEDGDREGFGLVLVEALGCEGATVVTDLPAMRDIVQDGKNAIVVPQKNARALAAAVIHLLGDAELSEKIGKAGRAAVLKRFDWDSIAQRYDAVISDVIHSQAFR